MDTVYTVISEESGSEFHTPAAFVRADQNTKAARIMTFSQSSGCRIELGGEDPNTCVSVFIFGWFPLIDLLSTMVVL